MGAKDIIGHAISASAGSLPSKIKASPNLLCALLLEEWVQRDDNPWHCSQGTSARAVLCESWVSRLWAISFSINSISVSNRPVSAQGDFTQVISYVVIVQGEGGLSCR